MHNKYNLDDKIVLLREEQILDATISEIIISKGETRYEIQIQLLDEDEPETLIVYESHLHKDIDSLLDFLRKQYKESK